MHFASAALYPALCVSRCVPVRLKLAPVGSGKPGTPLPRMHAVKRSKPAVTEAGTFTAGTRAGPLPPDEPPVPDEPPDADPPADDDDPGRAFAAPFSAASITGMHAASARR